MNIVDQVRNQENYGVIVRMLKGLDGNSEFIDPFLLYNYCLELLASKKSIKRSVAYELLNNILSSKLIEKLDGCLCSLIDRLPVLLSNISSKLEYERFLYFLIAIHDSNNENITKRYIEQLSRLVTSTLRLLQNPDTAQFGLSLLTSILSSKHANQITSHQCIIIIDESSKLLVDSNNNQEAAQVAALCISLESPEHWKIFWLKYCQEITQILSELGLISNKIERNSSITKSLVNTPSNLYNKSKSIYLERYYHGSIMLLKNMLLFGSSAGPVVLELQALLSAITSVMTTNLDPLNQRDNTKFSLESESKMSPADVCIVLPQLKIASMDFLSVLLSSSHPAVTRSILPLTRLVCLAMGCKECLALTSVAAASLELLRQAIRTFPSAMSQSYGKPALAEFLDLFLREVVALTASKSSVITSGSSSSSSGSRLGMAVPPNDNYHSTAATPAGPQLVLAVCEDLLLFCGPLLEEEFRSVIEIGVSQLLTCMGKGILLPLPPDRRCRRFPAEKIRCLEGGGAVLQSTVLSLAAVEVQSTPRGGVLSGNPPLLRRAAECCLSLRDTRAAAMRTLLVLDALLRPTAVALPALPVLGLLEDRIKKRTSQSKTTSDLHVATPLAFTFKSTGIHDVADKLEEVSSGNYSGLPSDIPVASTTEEEVVRVTGKRKAEYVDDIETLLLPVTKVAGCFGTHTIDTSGDKNRDAIYSKIESHIIGGKELLVEEGNVRDAGDDHSEDEDSLPDIDIEADIDS